MTQYGSSSDRPRGRRARPESDNGAGYDASRDDREFPDLQPIRPSGARAADARDGRAGGRHASGVRNEEQPRYGQEQYGGMRPRGRHTGGQPSLGQYGGGPQRGGQQAGSQAPWDAPQAPMQPPQYQQAPEYQQPSQYQQPPEFQQSPEYQQAQQAGSRQSAQPGAAQPGPAQPNLAQPGRRPGAQHSAHPAGWEDPDEDDPMAAFSKRWKQRGEETPEEARGRKRLYMVGGGVVVVVIAVLIYYFGFGGGGGAANTGLGNLVTTFLPGEMQQVPNACGAISASTISQALPGQDRMASPPVNSGMQSQCTWTLDHPPTYRVLQVNITAYSPSSLASGDGSATFAADDAFAQAKSSKQDPTAKSGQPKAAVADIPGVGSNAFSAFQVFDENGATMDMATVYVQYHNVIAQVVLNGLDRGNGGTSYGPVSQSQLQAQAQSVAQQVASKISGS